MPYLHDIALTLISGIGPVSARSSIEHFGTSKEVFNQPVKDLVATGIFSLRQAQALRDNEVMQKAEAELKFIEKNNIKVSPFYSSDYPFRLKQCHDAPVLLYSKGPASPGVRRVISIVGTRHATDYGKQLTYHLVRDLQPYGVTVVSGLAYGIDAAAHKACLEFDIPTIGIVAHGLDRVYPYEHRNLAAQMTEQGALFTEFPSGVRPDRENFPKRNRIVAGLADVTVVIEAAVNGGALITADLAVSYDRDVFAFPGRVNDLYSVGCNELIRANKAALATSAADIVNAMNWEDNTTHKQAVQAQLFMPELTRDEEKIMGMLRSVEAASMDELSITLQIPQSRLAMGLLSLEMNGLIFAMPGKYYKICL